MVWCAPAAFPNRSHPVDVGTGLGQEIATTRQVQRVRRSEYNQRNAS